MADATTTPEANEQASGSNGTAELGPNPFFAEGGMFDDEETSASSNQQDTAEPGAEDSTTENQGAENQAQTADDDDSLIDEGDLEGLPQAAQDRLREIEKKMQRTHTKRQQELAGERREIAERMARLEGRLESQTQPQDQVALDERSRLLSAFEGATAYPDDLGEYGSTLDEAIADRIVRTIALLREDAAAEQAQVTQTSLQQSYEEYFSGVPGAKALEPAMMEAKAELGGLPADPAAFHKYLISRSGNEGTDADAIRKAKEEGAREALENLKRGASTGTRRPTNTAGSTPKTRQFASIRDGVDAAVFGRG